MRPSSGGDPLPAARPRSRSRKSSLADHVPAHSGPPSCHVPTAFFLRSEDEMEQSLSATQSTASPGRLRESATFGVQSLADTLEAAFGSESGVVDKMASKQPDSSKSSPARPHKRKASNHATSTSTPLTPLNLEAPSPMPASALPSTPKSVSLQSLKLSDEESAVDDAASQAIASSSEEEDEDTQHGEFMNFPQLVMPSIQMPTRRPFTNKGKAMGKLKVLVAGESGVGKSSLIRSIVQLCEDIVHVDSFSPSQSFSQAPPQSKSRKRKSSSPSTTSITEIHASTKSYPYWWTELEESRALRRRKSGTDVVLERNLCFVDTPGFTEAGSKTDDINLVVDYVEHLLYQTASVPSLEDSDLLGIISGAGGVSVDVVLYLLPPSHDISKHIDFMQRLCALTNVIPLIAKSDTLPPAELVAIKTSILARLQTTSIKPFFFGKALDDALLAVQGLSIVQATEEVEPTQYPFPVPTYPYAVSAITGPDTDTMDASLLMSPDYVQPLLPSELATLVNQVFDPDSIAWLRYSAAKKFLSWRRRAKLPSDPLGLSGISRSLRQGSISGSSVGLNGPTMNPSSASSIFSAASPSGVLVPRATSPFYLSNSHYNSTLQSPNLASSPALSHTYPETLDHPTDFSLARYTNYAQGEQRLAEVRLAKWATDLQRSIRNERERFEEVQRSERAKWLLERVGEEVKNGNIVTSPSGSPRAEWAVVRRDGKEVHKAMPVYRKAGVMDSRDPLGLCEFSDEFRKRGFVLVKVLGGMSVAGAVVVAVVKACGIETGLPEGGVWSWLIGSGE